MNQGQRDDEIRTYWQSSEELHGQVQHRIEEQPPPDLSHLSDTTRRDFLTLAGFSLTAATLAACSRAPIQKAIPLLVASDDITPGVATWYATTCGGCPASCSLLVKTRDGRPIKIEGNAMSAFFGGGTCAVGQATVLSLYDDERFRGPRLRGKATTWKSADEIVLGALRNAAQSHRKVVFLSGTITSPSTNAILTDWNRREPGARHVTYEPVSLSALRSAHEECFGRAAIPHYRFDEARVIVSLDADFLGTWLSPVEFTRQYARGRSPETAGSRHIQFESGFSVTGSNADLRIPVAPSALSTIAVALLRRVARAIGSETCPEIAEPAAHATALDDIARELLLHRGRSLVVSGANDHSQQVVVAALNNLLGNIGTTVDLTHPSLQHRGDDVAMSELVAEMNRGEVGVLILQDVNPLYDYPEPDRFFAGLPKVGLSVSLARGLDETSRHADLICPDHHFLESWGDAEPVDSYFSLAQPTIAPLFDTRAAAESLLRWSGRTSSPYSYLREYWRQEMLPRQQETRDFDAFWDRSLRDGVFVAATNAEPAVAAFHGDWKKAAQAIIAERQHTTAAATPQDRYEVQLYESVALRNGRHANNPWLQELPDPISKVTWGNVAAISSAVASRLDLHEGDIVTLQVEQAAIELPVFIQPGQESGTISAAFGYGRSVVGKAGLNVGANVYPLSVMRDGFRRRSLSNVTLTKSGRHEALATTQRHFSMEGRDIVRELTLADLRRRAPSPQREEALPSLWAAHPQGDHAWGMVIDLNSCTGCSACVIACQAENNVPVVGKSEVQRTREMHWIRIDRYYTGSDENPESVHQPMMCQHCGNAPCETVCPVLATTHSSDGLNQQIYNRCVGTRYCANNCPYKVRRFNWFQYAQNHDFDFNMASDLGRMVLNPDVTVRSRGVMEKCSLCVQRVQAAKVDALQGKRALADGDIKTACQQACPAEAIVFGDLKDPRSRISQLRLSQRHYQVLDELGTRPSVGYLKKVRNPLNT